MKYTEGEFNEKPVIIIDEKPEFIPGQGEGETPTIIIEDDDNDNTAPTPTPRRRWPWIAVAAIISLLACLLAVGGYWYYRRYVNIGVPVSVTSEENIEKLKTPATHVKPEVVMTTDSILGVALNFYELRGLKAEISFIEPDTTDTEVYLYSRCSDFTSYDKSVNHYIGSLVMNGKQIESDQSRLGYCAMANDNIVIGISRNEKVLDYCVEQGGSFFRQFILVSNGVLPSRFYLHGKVERRALGRMGDKLYYIESRNAEAMWAFADAIREYGFIDAIYITGGNDYSFYRDSDGQHHTIGDVTRKEEKHKDESIIPWLIFKKR